MVTRMVRTTIPDEYIHYKSSAEFGQVNVPKLFLHEHNTKAGVYGKICVLEGRLEFVGFQHRRGTVDSQQIIHAGEHVVCAPEYWHKVTLLDAETRFLVQFFAAPDSPMVQATQPS